MANDYNDIKIQNPSNSSSYDNSYKLSIKPATPTLRGTSTNYSNDGQTNLGGIGLGDLYGLDYDRNKIENIFRQGTDAQYDVMKRENQIAQNQYANNQFNQQQSAIETLRQQRNSQIASGMARGLNAAQEQGTILGVQQDAMSGALELANTQQTQADKIAAAYAQNTIDALKEANSVKEAIGNISASLYNADMLGYTGELAAAANMDANAVNKYGIDKGAETDQYKANLEYRAAIEQALKNLEGTQYAADRSLEGTKYNADLNLEGTKYNADSNYNASIYASDRNLEGTKYSADKNYDASVAAASISAQATRDAAAIGAAAGGGSGNLSKDEKFIQYCYEASNGDYDAMVAALRADKTYTNSQAVKIANAYFDKTNSLSGIWSNVKNVISNLSSNTSSNTNTTKTTTSNTNNSAKSTLPYSNNTDTLLKMRGVTPIINSNPTGTLKIGH
ncbi:MAG: hypothetical protein MJ191_00095 [Clostridium sp.]|nr:hypothetical protein [Clostridium sp.]